MVQMIIPVKMLSMLVITLMIVGYQIQNGSLPVFLMEEICQLNFLLMVMSISLCGDHSLQFTKLYLLVDIYHIVIVVPTQLLKLNIFTSMKLILVMYLLLWLPTMLELILMFISLKNLDMLKSIVM